MRNLPLENSAQVVLNKAAFLKSPPCERALGGKGNVIRASTIGMGNSDLFGLITAHLVLKRLTERSDSGEVNQAYKDGVSDFALFFAECTRELELAKRQQEDSKNEKPKTA